MSDFEFTDDDLEIVHQHHANDAISKANYKSDYGKHLPSLKTRSNRKRNRRDTDDWDDRWADDDDEWEDEEENEWNIWDHLEPDQEELDQLLTFPMTSQERNLYTTKGISLTLETERSAKNCPRTNVNVAIWTPMNVIEAFNVVLDKFGYTTMDFTCCLVWKGQTSPLAVDYSDLSSLRIPWGRVGFHIVLKKKEEEETIIRCWTIGAGQSFAGPAKKRRKKRANAIKNHQNQENIGALCRMLDEPYKQFLARHPQRKSLIFRLVHLYSRQHWDKQRIQSFIHDNYMSFELKDAIDHNQNVTDLSQSDAHTVNTLTKAVLQQQPSHPTPKSTALKPLQSKYFQNVWNNEIDACLNQNTNNGTGNGTGNASTPSHLSSSSPGIAAAPEQHVSDESFKGNMMMILSENDALKQRLAEMENALKAIALKEKQASNAKESEVSKPQS
eukprot:967963_1